MSSKRSPSSRPLGNPGDIFPCPQTGEYLRIDDDGEARPWRPTPHQPLSKIDPDPVDRIPRRGGHRPAPVPGSPSPSAAQAPARTPAPRHDGFTPQRKRRFLKALGKAGCVVDACRAARVSDSAAYKARKRDPAFAALWKAALSRASGDIELVAWSRAVDGVEEPIVAYGKTIGTRRKYDGALLRILLKASNPERYGHHGFANARAIEKRVRAEIAAEEEKRCDPAEVAAARDNIMRKLERMGDRMVADGTHIRTPAGEVIPANYAPVDPPPPADGPAGPSSSGAERTDPEPSPRHDQGNDKAANDENPRFPRLFFD